MAPRRWGDNDRYFGPLTFAVDKKWRPFAAVLSSSDDEDRPCNFRLSAFGATTICTLPSWVLRPERVKVFPQWDAATIKRLGRDWYWNVTERQIGFSLGEGFLSVFYGRQTHDSSNEQRWGYFLPWTQWRFVRHSLYGLDGALFTDLPTSARWGTPEHDEGERLREECPVAFFSFTDFDGESLSVTTKIEERAWRLGEGWFKWLSAFARPKVRRSLDMRFSNETGRRKGSWKGGTIGCGIDLLPGELHEAAFRRHCALHDMTFIGPAPGAAT